MIKIQSSVCLICLNEIFVCFKRPQIGSSSVEIVLICINRPLSFLFRSLRSLAPSFTCSLYCAQNRRQMALSVSSRDALWHCVILALAISGTRRSSTPLALGARLLWRQACWHSCYSTLDRSGSSPLWVDALGLLRRFWLKVPTPDCPCPRLVWFWFAPIFGAFRRSAAPTFSPLGPQPRFGPPSRRSSTALVLSCSSL
jgi:hypothetical protein